MRWLQKSQYFKFQRMCNVHRPGIRPPVTLYANLIQKYRNGIQCSKAAWNWLQCICTSAFGSQFEIVAFLWNLQSTIENVHNITLFSAHFQRSVIGAWKRATSPGWSLKMCAFPFRLQWKLILMLWKSLRALLGNLLFINRTAVSIAYFIVIVMECKRILVIIVVYRPKLQFQ